MRLAEEAEKTFKKTKQVIYLIVSGRGGESTFVKEYFNFAGRKLKTNKKSKRFYGIGLCGFTGLVRLHKMFNEKRPIVKKVSYQRRNKLTGKLETHFKYEQSGEYIYGYRAIAQFLSKFIKISEDELKKIVEPYKATPRLYFFSAYEELGISLHNQPSDVEAFMGFKNYWKCSSGKPLLANTSISEQRFLWLNERAKELAKQQGLKGYWQIRIAPFEEETI